jgi:hypothetical protein
MAPKAVITLLGVSFLAIMLSYALGDFGSTSQRGNGRTPVTATGPVNTEVPSATSSMVPSVQVAPVVQEDTIELQATDILDGAPDSDPTPPQAGYNEESLDSRDEFNAHIEATMEEHMRLMEDYPPLAEENLSDEEVLHEMEQATAALIESGAGYLSGPPPLPDSSGATGSPDSPSNP